MYKNPNKSIIFKDLGLIDYQEAWDYQTNLLKQTTTIKKNNRKAAINDVEETPNYLLFCEHPSVYTLGKSGSMDNLLLNDKELDNQKISFYKINRGGDITFHGLGQNVGYPILDLDNFFTDLHQYMRLLEETIIRTLAEYGIKGGRIKGCTGVWLDAEEPKKARKICAFGVHCSRWITMHGWAFNVNTDLNYFNNIIPCGIKDDNKTVTSLSKELGHHISIEEISPLLLELLCEAFELDLIKFD